MPSPNDLLTNTQGQTNTTSNNGSGRVAKFKGKSHFFLEDETFTQTSTQAFGAASDDTFYTTARVSVTGKKIVAVCTGQIFVQPQTGSSSKVNVILKPYKQPVNGLAVKYFVYRGLPKSDFFDANGKVNASGTGATGLVNYIRTEFASFYSGATPPDFFGKYIGFPDTGSTQADTDYIDSYFYKVSQSFAGETGPQTDPNLAFELPMIPAGTHIATASGEIGFDIVLSDGDYYIENDTNPFKLDLKFARAAVSTLDVTTVTDAYQKKVLREACTRFIDPAAYYGLHANGGSIYKIGQTTAIETPANIAALIANFYTKNNIYIYIQSNRQRSYNFYGTQKISDTNLNNMKIGIAENSLTETTFETNKWPVKVFNSAATGAQQTIYLQLTTDRNSKTALFGKMANISSANQQGFVDAGNLTDQLPGTGLANYLTKSVTLSSPADNTQNIASFVQLIYRGKDIILSRPGVDDNDPNTPPPDPILYPTKYVDDIFFLTKATSFLVLDSTHSIHHVHSSIPVLYSQKSIDKNRNNVIAATQKNQNTIQIDSTTQLTLYTYLAIADHEQSNHSSTKPNASANKEATGYLMQSTGGHTLPNLPDNEYAELSTFTDASQTVTSIVVKTNDGSVQTSMVLGITETQHNTLKTLSGSLRNPMICFEPYVGNSSSISLSENPMFGKYKLGLLADEADLSQATHFPADPDVITVYTLDGLVFFSKQYSDYIERYSTPNLLTLDITL